MKFTDETAIKALKKVRVYDLEIMIDEYSESERNGRTDWEMLANETGWLLDQFYEYETCRHDDLEEAKLILARTRYGKVPALNYSGKCYTALEIQTAKNTVNEFNRLVRFKDKLKGMRLYVPNF